MAQAVSAAKSGVPEIFLHDTVLNSLTAEDPPYVTRVSVPCERDCRSGVVPVAIISTDRVLKVYSVTDTKLAFQGTLQGHQGVVHDVQFVRGAPHLLCSAAEDSSVLLWDSRTPHAKPIARFAGSEGMEFFSCCSNGRWVAGGASEGVVRIWDLRTRACFASLENHSDDVTALAFHPTHPAVLGAAGEDNLISVCDLSSGPRGKGAAAWDHALHAICSVEQPVRRFGFFGNAGQCIWCLTCTEELSLWSLDGGLLSRFKRPNLPPFLISCFYNPPTERLYLFGGTAQGRVQQYHVNLKTIQHTATLNAAHTALVRDLAVLPRLANVFRFVTGGEDSRVCVSATVPAKPVPASRRALPVRSRQVLRPAHPYMPP